MTTKEDWILLAATRLIQRGAVSDPTIAKELAEDMYDIWLQNGDLDESPEDFVDEDLTYWSNDE